MTQQEQIESIQIQFPQVGETRLRKMLNNANKRFVESTRIIQATVTASTVKDQKLYGFDLFTTDNGGELYQVIDVEVEDYKDNRKFKWYVDNDRVGVGIEDYLGGPIQAIPEAGLDIEVTGVFYDPGYGTTLSDEPYYDDAFHMGIVYSVIEDLHSERGNIEQAKHYYQKYRDVEVAAKKHIGSKGIKGGYEVKYHRDHSGRRTK